MKILKRMCGVTRPNRIRNEYTKKFMSNTDVARKMKENILRWFGRVERKDNDEIVKRIGAK